MKKIEHKLSRLLTLAAATNNSLAYKCQWEGMSRPAAIREWPSITAQLLKEFPELEMPQDLPPRCPTCHQRKTPERKP